MIELLSSGFYTSIQDLGRNNYTAYGVPLSGVMDQNLSKLANLLVGNSRDKAVLEMTFIGPKLKFLKPQNIAITAPEALVTLNRNIIKINHQILIKSGDILEIKHIKSRAYLAVSGGILSDKVLGSQSQYASITRYSKLKKEDNLRVGETENNFIKKNAQVNYDFSAYNSNQLEVFVLPEYHLLADEEQEILKNTNFSISQSSNRMAYQFDESFKNNLQGIKSVPVMPGTVQLTPNGKLIVLMRDAQVTGGYPRIFQLSEESINVLSQKSFKTQIKFEILKLK